MFFQVGENVLSTKDELTCREGTRSSVESMLSLKELISGPSNVAISDGFPPSAKKTCQF